MVPFPTKITTAWAQGPRPPKTVSFSEKITKEALQKKPKY
jgi:hypothetical protein